MKKLGLMLLMVVLVGALIFNSCTTEPDTEPATPEVFELRFANSLPEAMKDLLADSFFCDYAVEHSGGRIDITMHYGGSLGLELELLDLCKTGGADIVGFGILSFNQDALPIVAGMQFVYVKEGEKIVPFMNGIVFDNPETAPLCEEELARQNVEWMTFWSTGHGVLICNFLPAATLADLQGKKIGVGNAMPWVEKLGMHPIISKSALGAYEELSQGVVDALYASASVVHLQMLQECSKAYLLPGTTQISGGIAMNRDTWNSLPPDLQQVFRDAAAAAADEGIVRMQAGEEEAKRVFEESGCEVNILPPEDQLAIRTPLYNDWEELFIELCERTGISPDDRDTVTGYIRDFSISQ